MKWFQWIAIGLAGVIVGAVLNRFKVMNDLNKIRLSKNFVLGEFVRTSTGFDNIPTNAEIERIRSLAVNVLQPLRDYLARPVVITSGFRSQQVNEAVGGSETSQHRSGEAADFTVAEVSNKQIVDAMVGLRLPYDQLIDEKTKSKASGRIGKWVHVSYSSRHRSQVLSARFDLQQGKTVYSPYTA